MDKDNYSYQSLKDKYKALVAQRKNLEDVSQQTRQRLMERETEFNQTVQHPLLQVMHPREIKKAIRTTGAYILGRRNRKNIYSKDYKRKQAENDLKGYTVALYEKGFTVKALDELKSLFEQTHRRYLKRAAAWELALFFANQQTRTGALQALDYLKTAIQGETERNLLRRMAIIQAECYVRLRRPEMAKDVLLNEIQLGEHPDLYLALANTEQMKEQKLNWINKVYQTNQLEPIHICSNDEFVCYDNLQTSNTLEKISGPKVSVILPAFNSETGIQIAIESILNQTWDNIELLVVDDCSTDATLEVIQTYAETDSRIKVLKTAANSGPYVARNIALAHATGEYVTINDADDWSHPEKIATQASHLMNNKHVIANTSELARLTDDLQFYRRGTKGKYIFSNMSSLMFRRKTVLDKIGYWDNVRFAADGEFKRRLLAKFGIESVIDLQTGPLSLPRQTAGSLTGGSVFGYNGFFMGARQEYVRSFTAYYQTANSLYYLQNPPKRLFAVPEPMLPNGDRGTRHFDVVMAANFESMDPQAISLLAREVGKNKQMGLKTAFVQMYPYGFKKTRPFCKEVRQLVDGDHVQVVVYGEKVTCDILIIRTPSILMEHQQYIPLIKPDAALVIIDNVPNISYNRNIDSVYNFRQCLRQLTAYFDKTGRWYPLNKQVREGLNLLNKHDLRGIALSHGDWVNRHGVHEEKYATRIRNWILK